MPVKPLLTPPVTNKGNSLNRLKEKIGLADATAKPENTTVVIEAEHNQDANSPITPQAFETVFKSYIEELPLKNKMSFASILLTTQWQLLDESTVEFKMPSQHAVDFFEDERINFIPHFRKSLKNRLFEVKLTITATPTGKKTYTNKDRFEAIAEANPLVNDLKNLLMLDIE